MSTSDDGCCKRPSGGIARLDAELASLAREETALRLRLGQLLEVIGQGAVFDLGFSSLGAYAVERCERSARWAEGARCLARRLEALPELRRAMAMGKVSWSLGELLARVATPEDEANWLEKAECRTVRQVRVLVAEAIAARRKAAVTSGGRKARALRLEEQFAAAGQEAASPVDDVFGSRRSDGTDEFCVLTCTVNREDAWLFEATRYLLEHLGTFGAAEQIEALLAEAQGTLLAALPQGAMDLDDSDGCATAQQRWLEQLRRWREEAEAACEKNIRDELFSARRGSAVLAGSLSIAVEASLGISSLQHASCSVLDQRVRALAAALARYELELARLVLQLHRADGWRRLGYATETQYARERLGLSASGVKARRKLALQLERSPGIAAALGAGKIGVEAASQIVRIATPNTEAAWIERACRRTIKHLREEVAAALVAVRLAGERDCPPPEDSEMAAFQTLEQTVVSGRFGQVRPAKDASGESASESTSDPHRPSEPPSEARRAWWVMLGSLASWLEGGLQTSAADPSAAAACAHRGGASVGRVRLRLRMARETYAWWRGLEAQVCHRLPRGVSWLRFMCLCLWDAWRHLLSTEAAYGDIYIRDRFRCTVPVCNRRDVTPHHLQFRSAGGSDEACNITSPCTWCHLYGVHGGRIRATGTADHIRWELGPKGAPCLVVEGRERLAA